MLYNYWHFLGPLWCFSYLSEYCTTLYLLSNDIYLYIENCFIIRLNYLKHWNWTLSRTYEIIPNRFNDLKCKNQLLLDHVEFTKQYLIGYLSLDQSTRSILHTWGPYNIKVSKESDAWNMMLKLVLWSHNQKVILL